MQGTEPLPHLSPELRDPAVALGERQVPALPAPQVSPSAPGAFRVVSLIFVPSSQPPTPTSRLFVLLKITDAGKTA